jgi:hypothetical protein
VRPSSLQLARAMPVQMDATMNRDAARARMWEMLRQSAVASVIT